MRDVIVKDKWSVANGYGNEQNWGTGTAREKIVWKQNVVNNSCYDCCYGFNP